MDTISPVHADAFRLLLMDLYTHLCEAEDLASKIDGWSEEDLASVRRLIPDLLVAIRGLLVAHEITPSGNCRTCPSPWPCPVVRTLHALVKGPDREFVAILRRANEDG
ncbi:MAG TPA: hypothetical protein VGL88_08045 [Pseudonocardiaceae bacterium]|jgi:hypothetical protein